MSKEETRLLDALKKTAREMPFDDDHKELYELALRFDKRCEELNIKTLGELRAGRSLEPSTLKDKD